MQNKILNLISETAESLKSYSSGDLQLEDAASIYNVLNSQYEKIITDVNREKYDTGGIESICYYHNIENFSIFTGIYRINKNDVIPLVQYGDRSLDGKILQIISIDYEKLEEYKLLKYTPGENEEITHNAFIYPFLNNGEEKLFFLSLSSSQYFSDEKFIFAGKLLRNIISPLLNNEISGTDYFRINNNLLESYINSTGNDYIIYANIYVFNSINKIFDHTGIHSFFEISDMISKNLNKWYKYNTSVFVLSLKEYLVLERIKSDEVTEEKQNKKPEFIYKNIHIPFQSLKLEINKDEPLRVLWDQISVFENYLRTGDVVRVKG